MKKALIILSILVSFVAGIQVGIKLANRYSTQHLAEGIRLVKTHRLTGRIEIWDIKNGGKYQLTQKF